MSALFRPSTTSAFDGLYRRHVASVYRYAFAVLGNHSDAEDVTQATFLNAYRALAQGVKPRKPENWLLTIAHNQVRQHFRTVRGKPLEVELDDTLSGPTPEREEPSVADVLRALQGLSPAQRAAIVMREFEGRSYAEIAKIMELTPSALEALIFRARRGLAEQLEEALSCDEAEAAVSRRLDGRLTRRETRRLRSHMRKCPSCARFEHVQRDQRKLLKGLSLIPVPASLLLFRGETAVAATGFGTAGAAGVTAVAAGGSAGAGGAVGAGLAAAAATGLTAKVAAVGAAAAVVGGVGYGVSTAADPGTKAERKAAHAAAVENTREGARAEQVRAAKARGERPGPALPAASRARAATAKTKPAAKAGRPGSRVSQGSAQARANAARRAAAHPAAKRKTPPAGRTVKVKPARPEPVAKAPARRRSAAVQPPRGPTASARPVLPVRPTPPRRGRTR